MTTGTDPDPDEDASPDLLLRNCLDRATDVEVTVTRSATDETVHDGTHAVPTDSCSDFGDPVEVDSVFEHAGEYVVRAVTDGFDPASATVSITAAEVEGDTATRTIRVDEDGVTIA